MGPSVDGALAYSVPLLWRALVVGVVGAAMFCRAACVHGKLDV